MEPVESPADTGDGPIADETLAPVGIADDEVDALALAEDFARAYEQILLGVGTLGGQANRAIALAVSQKGIREQPCGSNVNPYSRYFGFGAQQWCADFVAWALDRTGNQDRKVPWGYPSRVTNITNWARSQKLIRNAPASGQIFTYRNGGRTGFVTGARDGGFTTIEGNTGGPDGRVCWVYDHRRRNDSSYNFIQWPW